MDDQHRKRPGDDSQRAHLNGEGMNMENELRPEVAAHLAEDASSPEELRELRATAALLGALPQVAPRRTFILTPEQVAASGGQRTTRRFGWVWPTRWATALAAVCFAITLGLGQGTSPEPTVIAPSPTMAVVTATTRSALDPGNSVGAFGTVVSVEPVPTALVAPPPVPVTASTEPTDWRPLQITLGALTALGAFFGFVLPPFLRRRNMATA
jgi:hypothetical protein